MRGGKHRAAIDEDIKKAETIEEFELEANLGFGEDYSEWERQISKAEELAKQRTEMLEKSLHFTDPPIFSWQAGESLSPSIPIPLQYSQPKVEALLAPFLRDENKPSFIKLIKRYRETFKDVFTVQSQQVPNQPNSDQEIWDSRDLLALQISQCFNPAIAIKDTTRNDIFKQLNLQNEKLQKNTTTNVVAAGALCPKSSQGLAAQRDLGGSNNSAVKARSASLVGSENLELIPEEPETGTNAALFDKTIQTFLEQAAAPQSPLQPNREMSFSKASEESLDLLLEPLLTNKGKDYFLELVNFYLRLTNGQEELRNQGAEDARWRNKGSLAQQIKNYILREERFDLDEQGSKKEDLFQRLQQLSIAEQQNESLPSTRSEPSPSPHKGRLHQVEPSSRVCEPRSFFESLEDALKGFGLFNKGSGR